MPLRRAVPGDARAIAEVHVRAWRETYAGLVPQAVLDALDVAEREALWRSVIPRADRRVAVAEADGRVVGFACAGPGREAHAGHPGEVMALYVLRAHHGKGLGRALFEDALAWLGTPAYLWVLRENPTRGFYARMGGRVLAERVDDVGGASLPEVAYGFDARVPR